MPRAKNHIRQWGSHFVATGPKKLCSNQAYNLPDLGGASESGQNAGSNTLPAYIHQ